MWDKQEMHKEYWEENLMEETCSEDLDGWEIIKMDLQVIGLVIMDWFHLESGQESVLDFCEHDSKPLD
jgi:hypothetical protein